MEKPSFYAVIPASVRYSAVTPNAKLLFGELTCLCGAEGYCWASNGYLAKLYEAGERTVSRWLTELEKAGFIRIEPAVNQYGQRRVFIADALPKVAGQKWQAKNGDHNNTSEDNTTSIELTPISPKPTKATTRAAASTAVQQHFGESPICPAEYANDASRNHGFSQDRIETAFAAFFDHHASKGSRFVDHRAAFRTWCRNEVRFAARGSGQAGGRVRDNAAAAVGAVISQRYGATQSGGSVGRGQGSGQADFDSGGTDLPF